MCSFDIGNFVNEFAWDIYTPIIGNARPLLYNFTIVFKNGALCISVLVKYLLQVVYYNILMHLQ